MKEGLFNKLNDNKVGNVMKKHEYFDNLIIKKKYKGFHILSITANEPVQVLTMKSYIYDTFAWDYSRDYDHILASLCDRIPYLADKSAKTRRKIVESMEEVVSSCTLTKYLL
jgi:hypothetical protein